jgi:hypothetical protein
LNWFAVLLFLFSFAASLWVMAETVKALKLALLYAEYGRPFKSPEPEDEEGE